MARRLILPLIILLALAAILVYVGKDQVVLFEVLSKPPEQGRYISVQALIIFSAFGLLSIVLLWSLLVWLWKLPKRMKSGIGRKREDRGLDAVEQALLAAEAGDVAGARKKAKRAQDLLNRPALTALISAKAAEMADESAAAESHYKSLEQNPDTQLAGLHGLARIAESRGDDETAAKLAKTALEIQSGKNALWAFDILFKSQIALYDWAGALQALPFAEKAKLLTKDQLRRRRSVLLTAQAAEFEATDQQEKAREIAKKAADTDPGFAPAAALAARLMSLDGGQKKAAQLIEKSWAKSPHPALALAFKELWKHEDAKSLTRKTKALIKTNPDHRESIILVAEMALDAGDGVSALSALGALLEGDQTSARLCVLSARAESLLQNPVDARTWQHRAACAPVEADWSDLDPNGAAFKYTNEDWRRLVSSYGDSGTLIHPRYEAYMTSRPVVFEDLGADDLDDDTTSKAEVQEKNVLEEQTSEQAKSAPVLAPSADDPGVGEVIATPDDLADRLDNLLDDNDKS